MEMDWLVVIILIFFIPWLFRREIEEKKESSTDFGKVCLFSAISGVVKLDGVPVAHAKLVRKSGTKIDAIVTNEEGYFRFEAKFQRTITKFLPQEFCASQVITVYYEDKEYKMWSGVKRKKEENAESRGKPLIVECELYSEEELIIVNRSPIFSLCTWDVEPDPKPGFEKMMKLVE